MKVLLALVFAVLCVGCDGLATQQKQQPEVVTPKAPVPRFQLSSSGNETFLVDTESGKVWRYDPKDKAFLEIPVASKIIEYDSSGNRVVPDPKDPLGILDTPKPRKN
jgi:hypothetical protein